MKIYAIKNSQQYSYRKNGSNTANTDIDKTVIGFHGGKENFLKITTKKKAGLVGIILTNLGIMHKQKSNKELHDYKYDIKTECDEAGNITKANYFDKTTKELKKTIEHKQEQGLDFECVTYYENSRPTVEDYFYYKGKEKRFWYQKRYEYSDNGYDIKEYNSINTLKCHTKVFDNSELEYEKFYYESHNYPDRQVNKYKNGDLEEIVYINRKLLSRSIKYANGAEQNVTYYRDNMKQIKQECVTDSEGNKSCIKYYENGNIKECTHNYINGDFMKETYNKDGATLVVENQKDGIYNSIEYYEYDDLFVQPFKTTTRDNKGNCITKEYFENGKISMERVKAFDGNVETTCYYNQDGEVLQTKKVYPDGTYLMSYYCPGQEKPVSTIKFNKDGEII